MIALPFGFVIFLLITPLSPVDEYGFSPEPYDAVTYGYKCKVGQEGMVGGDPAMILQCIPLPLPKPESAP